MSPELPKPYVLAFPFSTVVSFASADRCPRATSAQRALRSSPSTGNAGASIPPPSPLRLNTWPGRQLRKSSLNCCGATGSCTSRVSRATALRLQITIDTSGSRRRLGQLCKQRSAISEGSRRRCSGTCRRAPWSDSRSSWWGGRKKSSGPAGLATDFGGQRLIRPRNASRERLFSCRTSTGLLLRSSGSTSARKSSRQALFLRIYQVSATLLLFLTDITLLLVSRVAGSNVVSGLQDTNLARVRATHDYLLKCHHIFIVANISRAITDRSLQSSLFSVISRHVPLEWEESAAQSLKIAVVCTKTEVSTLSYLLTPSKYR